MSLEDRASIVRAALAEAGYPDAEVVVDDGSVGIHRDVPRRIAWRAFQVSQVDQLLCWECFTHANEAGRVANELGLLKPCGATALFEDDCGAERPVIGIIRMQALLDAIGEDQ